MNNNSNGHNGRAQSQSGPSFGPSSGFPPDTEIDKFDEISVVGGPLNSGPDHSPSLSHSSPFGPGSFLPPTGMGLSSPMGTRERDSFSGFDSPLGMNLTGSSPGQARPNPRDGSSLYNSQFPPRLDDSGFSQGHSVGGGGIGEPGAILPPSGPLMMPYPSHLRALKRTHSAPSVGPDVGMGSGVGSLPEMAHRPGNPVKVKFRLKGQPHSGISVAEAINRERLSQNHEYMMHDIAPDTPGKMTLKVRVRCLRSHFPSFLYT
jgi:hypothetical protein